MTMTPGPGEEVGKTARTIVDAMHDSPITLALLVINLVFVGVVAWGSYQERGYREKVSEMLYHCTPDKSREPGG